MPPAARGGPHELGQNHLVDRRFPAAMADLLRHGPPHPVLELGAGTGAVTGAPLTLGHPVTAVELDPRAVVQLRRLFAGPIRSGVLDVVEADLLTVEPAGPHDVVSNVPFGITTPLLRALLPRSTWSAAVLLVQGEVARKRAGVGGTTALTAAWWPWYTFALDRRVPAAAFRPVPAVDGGVLVVRRRAEPLLADTARPGHQRLVREVFTGRGRGIAGVLRGRLPDRVVQRWLAEQGLDGRSLPRDLLAEDWAALYRLTSERRPSGR